ncbi:PREDICTED: mucin-6-like [Wasmannia auropunctata]|uniref:mucin-6-like n=1 Tax=Wasmannia auropunctata TaxID=64793 RepID=UPI0005EF4DF4|nr:PREDICTED: mucin-6-like [Wasmannia auropunctata]
MSRVSLVLLVVIGVLCSTTIAQRGPQRCGPNQVWDTCGTACPLTCHGPNPETCTYQCVAGCRCREGYLLNNAGTCVDAPECYASEWNGALSSVYLELYECKQRKFEDMARAVAFLLLIVAVATINAAPNCGPNEQYNSCGTKCQPTCENPSPQVCTLACIPGCECVSGFVKNANNQCVLTQQC